MAAVALVVPAVLMWGATPAAAQPPAAFPGTVVAVRGVDNGVWIKADLPNTPGYGPNFTSGWFNLGGSVNGPPAIVDVFGQPYYIAISSAGGHPEVRTINTGWNTLGPGVCLDTLGATYNAIDDNLFVGCDGQDHNLYVGTAKVMPGQIAFPSLSFTNFGSMRGGLAAGPAAAFPSNTDITGETPSFFAVNAAGEVWSHGASANTPWTDTSEACGAGNHLAADSEPHGGTSVFACTGPSVDGSPAMFSPVSSSSVISLTSQGGIARNGPGVTYSNSATGKPIVYVQGSDGAVWGHDTGRPATSWNSLGGIAVGGVQAAFVTLVTAAGAVLSVSKALTSINGSPAASGAMIAAGDVLAYTITVSNTGTTGSTTLTDVVPADTTFNGGQGWTCAPDNNAGSDCTQTITAPPGNTTVPFTVTAASPLPSGTTISNTVSCGGANTCSGSPFTTPSNPVGEGILAACPGIFPAPMVFQMTGNCTTMVPLTVPDGWTINGGGFTLTGSGNAFGAILSNASGAMSMTVENLVVDGAFTGWVSPNPPLAGIQFNDAGGTLSNVTVNNITVHSGVIASGGFAIRVAETAPETVDITTTSVADWQRGGIFASGPATMNVTNSDIHAGDPGDGLPAQNSLQYSTGAGGMVTGSIIEAHSWWNPAVFAANTAAILNGSNGVTFDGNTFLYDTSGVASSGTSGPYDTGIGLTNGSTNTLIEDNTLDRTPHNSSTFGVGVVDFDVEFTSGTPSTGTQLVCNTFPAGAWTVDLLGGVTQPANPACPGVPPPTTSSITEPPPPPDEP